ncbi:MAG: copper resistance protein CopC [Acidimicrobiales bacterium]
MATSVAALAVSLAVLGWATPAAAHADFVSSTPAAGSIVAEAPSDISLQFTEGVDLQSDGIRLLDADGAPVALGPATADGATATVPIEAERARGSYVVAWRAVSADGHPIRGAFTFSVGQRSAVAGGIAEGAFGSTDDRALEVTGAIARFVAYLGTLGACGAVLVGARLRRPDEPTPVGRAVVFGLGAALVALGIQLVALGALVTGEGFGSITQPGVLALVFDEGFGITAVVAVISLLGVTITAGLPFEGAARSIALVGAAGAPVSMVLYGHTRTMSPAWLGYTADAIHLLAGTVWFGGLLATIAIVRLRRRHDEPEGAAAAIATFSGIAAIATGLVVAAGTAMSWIEVGSIEALTSTTYGQLLLAKIFVVVVVLACAAWNRFRLLPHVAAGADDAHGLATLRSLRRVMTIEVALIVAALAITSVLVNVTPAKAIADPEPTIAEAPLADGTVVVTVEPARAGPNDLVVEFRTGNGSIDDQFREISVQLELPEQGIGPIDIEAERTGAGHFEIADADLTLPGPWVLTVSAKADRFTEVQGRVEIPIGAQR